MPVDVRVDTALLYTLKSASMPVESSDWDVNYVVISISDCT